MTFLQDVFSALRRAIDVPEHLPFVGAVGGMKKSMGLSMTDEDGEHLSLSQQVWAPVRAIVVEGQQLK